MQQAWNAVFGQDPNMVGRKISINGHKFEVVGVCKPDFTGIDPVPIDFFAPITMQSALSPGRDLFGPEKPALIHITGRLRPGISVDQAQAALTVFVKHATEQLAEAERAIQATLTSKATALPLNAKLMAAFLPLIAGFGLVLLICCANVSNMMLARAVARQREIGVRLSLGMTANYVYRIADVEENHEAYAKNFQVVASHDLERLAKGVPARERKAQAKP